MGVLQGSVIPATIHSWIISLEKGSRKYVIILAVACCLLFLGGNRVTVSKTVYGIPQEEIQRSFGGLIGTMMTGMLEMTASDNTEIENQHEVNRGDIHYGRFGQGFMLTKEKEQGRAWIVYPDCIAEVSLDSLDETGMPEHLSWHKENKGVYYMLSVGMLGSY